MAIDLNDGMSLSSLQLDAFTSVAQTLNFSVAARRLGITQPSLSQRILNLEKELRETLFIREPSGIRLTETGRLLLKCSQERNAIEAEFLDALKNPHGDRISGLARIGAFSTLSRSVLLPKIASFKRAHPEARIQLLTRELHELPGLLRSGEADFIFTSQPPSHPNPTRQPAWAVHEAGVEENVLIESRSARLARRDTVYLDHDEQDRTTHDFWAIQKTRPAKLEREYFDEIYAIIDAVAEGLGRAVVPLHLIEKDKRVKVVQGWKPLKVPYSLVYPKQAYYTRFQLKLISEFTQA
jgi:DNA-binding transcriptional LysR family regulator